MENAMEIIKSKGAFLTVKNENKINTMTIGWANIGYQWKKPILAVMVRKSRYTFEMIERSSTFTVSIPVNKDMKKEVAICGSKSGRDIDKFKECNLKVASGRKVETPIIENCDLHYECKIVYKEAMNPEFLSEEIKENCYKNGDYHTIYYGEIVDCYLK
ncbi:flavin reductase (DIM6/NTAB) family NADH-FMN oxidoreductase RutF [Clostridium tetanomorphum]|nr:flavin reductase family protein [Clostridium tetanomorphum]MBP1865388.1 flavin reductase (DIM6/NTAB) family NADH-FMN oxidoreductase RutF [Clostridium tetanomorphum]NRS84845.1 flavin reductase (DIM6/NTAB) family NADH-FMN oxidoreductase RutF [Clostridium tetanomorphum]